MGRLHVPAIFAAKKMTKNQEAPLLCTAGKLC